MATLKTYDSAQVSVIVGTREIKGRAEGTFITVARDEQIFTKQVGSDGEVTRAKTNNKAGTISLTIQQGSDGNDFLSALAAAESSFPVLIKDNSGTTLIFSELSWMQDYPDVEIGRDAGEREWVIDCADIEMGVGGN